jgi:hypothetical protein
MYIIGHDGNIIYLEKTNYAFEEEYYIQRYKKEFNIDNPYTVDQDKSFYLYKKNISIKINEKENTQKEKKEKDAVYSQGL